MSTTVRLRHRSQPKPARKLPRREQSPISTALSDQARQAKREQAKQRRRRRWRRWAISPRMRRLAHLLGWANITDSGLFTSTRQAEALNPALVETHPLVSGVPRGVDLTTNQPMAWSPHALYLAGKVTSMNVIIAGDVGTGKTYLTKAHHVIDELVLGHRVAVFDRKRQSQASGDYAGEYALVSHLVDGQRISLDRRPGSGTTINPLDPRLARAGDDDDGIVGQDTVVEILAEAALARPLADQERYALQQALAAAWRTARAEQRVAELADLVDALFEPDQASIPGPKSPKGRARLAELGVVVDRTMVEWGLPVALGLSRFLPGGNLSGLFDGPTGQRSLTDDGTLVVTPIDLRAQFLVIDTSALPEGSVALGLAVIVMSAYLGAAWADIPGPKTVITEEAYTMDELGGAVARVFRSLAKRGRGSGLAVVTVLHHLSDVPVDSPVWSLIRECEIVHLMRQDKADDAAQAVELWQLEPHVATQLMELDKGRCLTRLGRQGWTWMRVLSTPFTDMIGDSDQAIRGVPLAAPQGPDAAWT